MNIAELQSPIILVENELTAGGLYDHWKDATGERYQYPNRYKNKVLPGRRFVYYRGSRRSDGSRAMPEYFGHGRIASTRLDPENDTTAKKENWKWLCDIGEYWEFPRPVPFKIDDVPFEDIYPNQWGVAVREITDDAYESILKHSGLGIALPSNILGELHTDIKPTKAETQLLVPIQRRADPNSSTRLSYLPLRSSRSQITGRRGEEIALKHLHHTLPESESATLRWVSEEGETPGWDIEYICDSKLVAVEVKATTGQRFPAIELTANEWRAALEKRSAYKLLMVANALSDSPIVDIVTDPATAVDNGYLEAEPSAWKLTATAERKDE